MKQALKSYLSDPIGKWLLILLMLAAVLSIGIGLALGPIDFSGNLLAEVAGNAVSILLGLLVIDWFLEYRRKREWSKAEEFTLRAIAVHLCEIAGSTFLYFPGLGFGAVGAIFEGHIKPPNPETSQSFEDLLDELCSYELPMQVARRKSPSDIAIDYYETVRWDLDQIQNVLTPRVIQSPADQALIDLLVGFDDSHRELRHSIIGHKQACTQGVFPHVILLVKSAGHLYRAIYERLGTDEAQLV